MGVQYETAATGSASGATLETVGRHLERFGWPKYDIRRDADGDVELRTGWHGEDGSFPVRVLALRGPAELVVECRLLMAPQETTEPARLARLQALLLGANYGLRRGAWGRDERDGEVTFTVSHLLDGRELAYEPFETLLSTVLAAVRTTVGPARRVLAGPEADSARGDRLLGDAREALARGDREAAARLLADLTAAPDAPGRAN